MAASLNSWENFRRDNTMARSSVRWVLSLNRLSQKWGRVQFSAGLTAGLSFVHRYSNSDNILPLAATTFEGIESRANSKPNRPSSFFRNLPRQREKPLRMAA